MLWLIFRVIHARNIRNLLSDNYLMILFKNSIKFYNKKNTNNFLEKKCVLILKLEYTLDFIPTRIVCQTVNHLPLAVRQINSIK